MLESAVLIFAFTVWAMLIWRSAPPLMTEDELASEDFCYTYTTTPLRRFVVMLSACISFAFVMWLLSYAITYLIWRELLSGFFAASSKLHFVVLAIVVAGLIGLVRLPGVKRFIMDVCVFFQRCQFFPMLPSPKEENLMEQIANLPLGVLPKEIESVLNKEHLDRPQDLKNKAHLKTLYDDYYKLEVLQKELQQLSKARSGLIRRFYFGSEWELIQNQFRVIDKQMNANNDDLDQTLAKKIRTCLYYSYGLLTRVIMETSNNTEESKALFQYYGFDVSM